MLSLLGDSLRINNYRTVLAWWGTDQDGRIIGYAYKWDGPWSASNEDSVWWQDSTWAFTTATRDTFDVPVGGSYAERTFQVRAIDNDLLADPEPAQQLFKLENWPPLVSWSDTLRHPTHARPSLPAISFAFTPEDYDGRETVSHAFMWLDTIDGEDPALSRITVEGDTVGAFFPEHFQGRYGERTVYLQLFDKAATGTDTISWSWTVLEPQGEYLLIDNAGASAPSGTVHDNDEFWRSRMESIAPGNYHIYDVWDEGVFRSRQEVLPLFQLFKGIVWYGRKFVSGTGSSSSRESDEQMYENLTLAQASLIPYAESGGALLISGHNAIGSGGALTRAFWQDQLGISLIFTRFDADYDVFTTNMDLRRRTIVHCGPSLGGVDSVKVQNTRVGMSEFFRPGAHLEPLFSIDPDDIQADLVPEPEMEPQKELVFFGVRRPIGDGHIALCTVPLFRFEAADAGTPEDAVEALLRDLFGL